MSKGRANGRSEILVLVPGQARDDNIKSGVTLPLCHPGRSEAESRDLRNAGIDVACQWQVGDLVPAQGRDDIARGPG